MSLTHVHVGGNHVLRDTRRRQGERPRVGARRCGCNLYVWVTLCLTVNGTQAHGPDAEVLILPFLKTG